MRSIQVEPSRLESAAASIDNANSDYQSIYQAMYAEVDKMSASWKGKDNTVFVNQIKAFQDDLRQISIVMKQYADFLRSSARAYRQAQDEIASQGGRLRTN